MENNEIIYNELQSKIPKLLDSIAEQSLIKIVGFGDLDTDSQEAVIDDLYRIKELKRGLKTYFEGK